MLSKQKGLIKGFHVGKAPHMLSITRLQFVDGPSLFSSHNDVHLGNLFHAIHAFEEVFRLNINCHSRIWVSVLMCNMLLSLQITLGESWEACRPFIPTFPSMATSTQHFLCLYSRESGRKVAHLGLRE